MALAIPGISGGYPQLLSELRDKSQATEANKKLLASFSITQCAGFTAEEENLLSEMIEETLEEE